MTARQRGQPHPQPHPYEWRPEYDTDEYPPAYGAAEQRQGYYTDAYSDWDEYDEYEDRRRHSRVGLISPLRVLLALVVVVAGAVAGYGMLFEVPPVQMPMAIVGLALFGVALLVLSLSLARAAAQLGRRGRGGRALVAAFIGGLCIIGAAGALGGTYILLSLTASL